MKKLLFITKDTKFQGNKECLENRGTLNVGTLFNFVTNIIKQRVKNLLFNKAQFNVSNYTSKCDTAYVELNPDFIETLTPKLNTGSTDNPLADNGVQIITSNVKTIAVYDQQLEFVDSVVEVGTSTLKLKDEFVEAILNNQNNKIKQFTIYNQQPFSNNITQDLVDYMNTDTPLDLDEFEIGVIDFYDDNLNKVQFLFGPGKGSYGVGFIIATLPMLYQLSTAQEADTLQNVTDRGNITTNNITTKVGNFGLSMIANYLDKSYLQAAYALNQWNPLQIDASRIKILEKINNAFIDLVNGNIGIHTSNPTAKLHSVGTVRHENLTNAQGDSTFAKQVVAKADGTIGVEDKILGTLQAVVNANPNINNTIYANKPNHPLQLSGDGIIMQGYKNNTNSTHSFSLLDTGLNQHNENHSFFWNRDSALNEKELNFRDFKFTHPIFNTVTGYDNSSKLSSSVLSFKLKDNPNPFNVIEIQNQSITNFKVGDNGNTEVKTLNIKTCPIYSNNTDALAGGLTIGDVYRTSTGQLMITF